MFRRAISRAFDVNPNTGGPEGTRSDAAHRPQHGLRGQRSAVARDPADHSRAGLMGAVDPLPHRRSPVVSAFIVSSGNFLEMYDFMVYGYYAQAIAKAYFPASDPYASTLATFAAFGAGFLMRPVGALTLGAVIDRLGRRTGLLITLGLMAIGTATIAATPRLCPHRPGRPDRSGPRPSDPGSLGGGRAGRRLGLSGRDGRTRLEKGSGCRGNRPASRSPSFSPP